MPDFIFVAMEDWDDIWRRNQPVAAELARRFPQNKLLFVGLARDVSHAVRKREWRSLFEKTADVPESPNISVIKPPKFLPNTIPACRLLNERLTRWYVRRAAKKLGIQNPIFWTNPQYTVHMVGRMNESGVIYDIGDDWTQFTQSPAETRLVAWQDKTLCRRADAVIVVSQRLYDLKKPLARCIELIPNGVDVEGYAQVDHARKANPEAPAFGYTGTLHVDRVNTDLVLDVARAFPQGRILLVGPNMLPPEETSKLQAQPNIELRGTVHHSQIPQIMSEFDVSIVPHVESAFTESLNPLKLWEYLAAGKPIVSTNVAGFRDYQPLCRIASGSDNFIQACHEAVQEAACDNSEIIEKRQAEAAKNSWKSRVDEIVEVLNAIQR